MSIICALCVKCKCVFYMCVCTCLCCKICYFMLYLLMSFKSYMRTLEAGCVRCHGDVNRVVWVFTVYVCMQMNFALNTKSERPVVTCLCIIVCPCNRSWTLCPGLSLHLSCGVWWIYQACHSGCWSFKKRG